MNNEPVAWMNPVTLECGLGGNVDWEDTGCIPLYTHPTELNAGGEPVKNASYWKRKHDGLLMKLSTSAIKISELEKDLALKTRDRDVFKNFTLAYEERIAELEKDLKYFTNPCDPMCKPSICDCYQARFAINNRKTLTDEDIKKIYTTWLITGNDPVVFAKAILKKASEK